MPIARVELPDGRIARMEVPAGTTPQQVESFVFEQLNKPVPKFEADARKAEKPSGLVRFGRGFADVTEGVKQGALMVKDLFTDGNEADSYTKDRTEELNAYERGRGPDAGIDWLRMGGNLVATAPTAAIGGGATLPLRMLTSGAQGAAASGMMFTPEGESKAAQIATGGILGAAMPAVVQGVRSMIPKAPVSPQAVERELTVKLQQHGIDFGKLTNEVRTTLAKDAQKALSAGGSVDGVLLERKALIEGIGAKPTKAAITRAPRDWQAEKNLRGIQNVGEPIVKREQENAQAMIDYLGRLRQASGGRAGTVSEAGENAISAMRGVDAADKAVVDAAYGQARDHLGRAAPMNSKAFSDAANLSLDEGMLGHYLPGEVRSILNDLTAGKIPFNVNTAVQIDSTLSAAQRTAGQGSPQALAIGKVRDALNKAPIADNVGEEAKAMFDRARSLARGRFANLENNPALTAAVDDIAPDKFVQKFILNADARDMRSAFDALRKTPDGTQAIRDIKGHVFDTLMLKATGSTNMDDIAGKPFSGVRFGKALDSIQAEKLHQLFSPSELESLRSLQKASKLLTEEVPFSDVNHSKTTAALANLLQKVGTTPMLSQIIAPIAGVVKLGADWTKDAQARKQVAEALLASAGKKGSASLPAPRMERVLPAVGAAAGYQASQEQ